MRKALNENPLVQLAVLGVLGVFVAFMLITRVMGGDEAAPPPASPTPSATSADAAGAPAESATSSPAAPEAAEPSAPEASAPKAPASKAPATNPGESAPTGPAPGASAPAPGGAMTFVPGPGLPEDVVVAYAQHKTVVLLVVRRGGLDDRALRVGVERLRARPDTAVFVIGAHDIFRYSRITEGVDVTQVPALVVLRPRDLTADVPTGSVSYGFRGPESIVQAVEDALYKGRELPYYPE